MHRPRLLFATTLLLVAFLIISGQGQTGQTPAPNASRRTLVSSFAPPPIERGISPDTSHAPRTLEERRRQSIRAVNRIDDRRGASGTRYAPGRVIVKFRDGVSAASRAAALPGVSRTARLAARAASQNFDVVQTDVGEDGEAVARARRARGDVEYAQAAYRVHPNFVPNDRFYPDQWNLPLIGMERAWDIQPAGGSAVTVAVLDTGIAFRQGTMTFTAGAFTLDFSGS